MVLNWAWVFVHIKLLPFLDLSLHFLEWIAVEVNIFASYNKVRLLEANTWMGLDEGKDWDGTNSPVLWGLSDLSD